MADVTGEDVVLTLKRAAKSCTAKEIAERIGVAWGVDSRAVATAARKPVKDGRVTISYRKGIGFYRFVRLRTLT